MMGQINISFLAIMISCIHSAQLFPQTINDPYYENIDSIVFKVDSNSEAAYEAHAKVFFIGNDTIVGKNNAVSGEITLRLKSSVLISARIVIDAGAFVSGIGIRDQHIREILDVNRYPQIIFELSRIEGFDTENLIKTGSGNLKVVVEGTLQVHGITKEIRFPIHGSYDRNSLFVEGTVQISYSDFNIEPPTLGLIVKQASNELKVSARISSIRVK